MAYQCTGRRLIPILAARVASAERRHAHRRFDTLDDQLLEVLLTGEPRPVGEGRAVMPERGQEGAAAVVILAPRDRMELAMTGMRRALGREHVLVDVEEDLHLGWEGHEVVPLILEGPAPRQAVQIGRAHV